VDDAIQKFANVLELINVAERAFVYKLKKKDPDISEEAVQLAVRNWYQERPGAELGDADGVPGDIRRFEK
jgi:hypothetical protein